MKDKKCFAHECTEKVISACDLYDRYFCEEYGTKGGDKQVEDVGVVAYPSQCCYCQEK